MTHALSPATTAPTRIAGQRVRVLVSIAAFLLFSSYIPSYLYLIGYTTINPGTVVAIFSLVTIGLWLVFDRSLPARPTLTFAWCVLFVALNILTAAVHGLGPDFYQRAAGAAAIVFLVVFCFPQRISVQAIQWGILVFACFNLACVTYDFFVPGVFVDYGSPFYNAGRGAGFFVNANKSGLAAVYMLILAAATDRSKPLGLICLVCGLWVALTLSRTAILAYALVCIVFVITGKFRVREFFVPVAVAIGIAAVGFAVFLAEQEEGAESIRERLEWFGTFGGVKDHASDERILAASNAIKHLADSPLVGHGFGSVSDFYGLPPHNLYLTFGADYGIVGVILLLLWLLVVVLDWKIAGSPPELRSALLAWVVATAFVALFFDEVLGINYIVFCLAWIQHRMTRAATTGTTVTPPVMTCRPDNISNRRWRRP